ncbi:MAG TPA: UDP-N-acetylmuramate--L-alanine ligase [Candidatus Cottocaccamicrobium excrementipullorum]|nr:UDP-N-acetylmuramate--L-alanine ligase [Candidatus Cottocaccamicrobium excrementipullorum]
MYQIDFNRPQKIYFIGIGGISMSGLAEILFDEGFQVMGSDMKKSELTDRLEQKGIKVEYGQRASNIPADTQVVVYTAAIHPDNPEFVAAKEMGIPMLARAELLGELMRNYHHAVNIAGTHGKTTTTSMLTEILLAGEKDPTVTVGGILPAIGGNIRVGGSELFVAEACEYTNSFLSFFPTMEIILNIEADHLDFFKDIEDIRHSFRRFAQKLDEKGILIINREIPRLEEITEGLPCKVITFGRNPETSNYSAAEITYDQYARASYTLMIDGKPEGKIVLGVPGEHNVYNSLSVVAAGRELGITLEQIQKGLKCFSGTNRRFEKKGEIGGVTVIDDYAHHPQEIRATLTTAKNYPHRKIWCVFQPHTYSRTAALLDEFAQALLLADEVILADIYAAREVNTIGITSQDLADKIREAGGRVHYIPSFDEIETFILENCVPGDLLITMGAGDIVKVGEKLLGM